MANFVIRLQIHLDGIKIKLRSFKSSEHINEKGMGHTAVSATLASSVTL